MAIGLSDDELREIRKLAVQYALELHKANGGQELADVLIEDAKVIEKYIVSV